MNLTGIIIIILLLFERSNSFKLNHNFFSLETVQFVDQSKSILGLNKCKSECLQMKDYFPFKFRYHRVIIRQTDGMVKYFIGHCQVKMTSENFQEWNNLKAYIDSTNIFGDNDTLNQGQGLIWKNYDDTCEDKKLQLSPSSLQGLKLERTHSDFLYYDDGSFQNNQPFDDIDSMMTDITNRMN